eukprot:1725382-Prymnesium_polylepis.1
MRRDGAALAAQDGHVAGCALQRGAHDLDREGAHPQDHHGRLRARHLVGVAGEPTRNDALEARVGHGQMAWRPEPTIRAEHGDLRLTPERLHLLRTALAAAERPPLTVLLRNDHVHLGVDVEAVGTEVLHVAGDVVDDLVVVR